MIQAHFPWILQDFLHAGGGQEAGTLCYPCAHKAFDAPARFPRRGTGALQRHRRTVGQR